jgi:hypothetical protein
VLRDLEQIDDAQESRLSCQRWSDIQKSDRLDRIHFDLAFVHTVSVADLDVESLPYSDTASDFSATNSIAEPLGEHHEKSLHSPREAGGGTFLSLLNAHIQDRHRRGAD